MNAVTNPDAASTRSGTPPRPWLRPAVLGALVLVTRLPGFVGTRTFNTDEATLAVGGRVLRGGGHLYVDFIDRKPPLPFAVYALLGTADLRWVRLFIAVMVFATALLIASEADRRWGRRSGWVAGAVVAVGAGCLAARDAQAANFELFALLPIAGAVVAAARRRPVLAGVALAVAVLCKQPAAITAIPVLWVVWRTRRWVGLAWCVAAGAVATVVLSAPFGVGRVLHWAILGTGGYLSVGPDDLVNAAVRLLALAAICLGFWAGAWLLVLGPPRDDPDAPDQGKRGDLRVGGPKRAASAHISAEGSAEGSADPALRFRGVDDADVWLLLAVSIVAMLPGLRLFPHYLIQLLPALGLLAARGSRRRGWLLRPAVLLGGASIVVCGVLAWPIALSSPPAWQRETAAYVDAHSGPDDTVLVWGNASEILWSANRWPAGGYPHSEFFTGYSGGRVARASDESTLPDPTLYDDWLQDLAEHPPAVVVDTAAADLRGGSYYPLANFPRLDRFVQERYRRAATIEGIVIYLRNDGATP